MTKDKAVSLPDKSGLVPVADNIEQSILIIRGNKVLLDMQLADFYGVEVRTLVQAVKRNRDRFPDDFMFQLTVEEWDALKQAEPSQDTEGLRSQFVILKAGRGQHRKFLPYAFTEQGVAMLSGVLRSPQAVEVNIRIMRAFVRLRQLLTVNRELANRLAALEKQVQNRDKTVDQQFQQTFELLERLFNPPDAPLASSERRTNNSPR